MTPSILLLTLFSLVPVISLSRNQCYSSCVDKSANRGCKGGTYCPGDGTADCKIADCKSCVSWNPNDGKCWKCLNPEGQGVVTSSSHCDSVSADVNTDDDDGGVCLAVDSTVLVVENGETVQRRLDELDDITIQKVWTETGVAEVQVMTDIMTHIFDYKRGEASFHGSMMIRIETESGKFVKATPSHQFHAGETCCSYSSLRQIQDLQVGDYVWTINDEETLVSERIVSKSEPEHVPRQAIVVPLERIKPNEQEDGTCTWDIKNSVIVNGFITSHHAGGALDKPELESLGFTVADQFLLIDSNADHLFLGLQASSSDNNPAVASITSEDDNESFSVFLHSLNSLLVHCTFINPCDEDSINEWFATFPSNVQDLVELNTLIESGSFSQLTRRALNMDAGVNMGQYFLDVIERYSQMANGRCDTLTLSSHAEYLYRMFFAYNSYYAETGAAAKKNLETNVADLPNDQMAFEITPTQGIIHYGLAIIGAVSAMMYAFKVCSNKSDYITTADQEEEF